MSNDHPGTTDSTTGPAESAIDPQSRNSPDPAHAVTENLSAIAADVAAVTHDLAAERQTTSQPESDSSVPHQPLPPETDAVEFRVMRSGSPVRRLRLSGHRYTFGSGEGCSIRLSDPALRPMHAVLIRDLHRILVRAYSVPLEINGQRLAEATLELGDVMRMGAYRFELIGVSIADDDAHAGFQRAIADQQLPPAHAFAQPKGIQSDLPTAFGEAGSVLDQTAPGPGDEESLWRQRLRNEVEQWRARQADCDRRHARCDQREASLRNRESELWSQAEKLRQREKQLKSQESAALQIQAEYADKQHELELIREESRDQQRDFERREAEFKQSEAEYQQRVDEASAQLHQSQQQAASATEAVQRMREQFTSLNEQLEALTSQQTTIERREQERTTEFQKTCDDLEHARDQAIAQRDVANHERDEAIDRHARSEAARHEIEDQIDELSQLLQQAEQNLSAERERYVASELDAETLRKQVIELQENVQEAGEEASRLREGYERACEQVRDLERMAADSQNRSESDRSSWLVEADQLRSSVETMSIQLVAANGELTQLRQSNEELIEKLAEAQEQRDEAQQQRDEIKQQRDHAQRQCDDAEVKLQEACEDRDHAVDAEKRLLAERDASDQALAQAIEERARAIEDSDRAVEQLHQAIRDRDQSSDELRTRPTAEAWEQLRQELKAANDQIAELTQQYEQTLQRLDDAGTSETGPAELAPPVWGLESDADSTEDPETESVSTSGWSDTAFGPESTVGQESANDPEASVESFDVQRDDTAADSTSWGNANDTLGLSTRESLALDTATADTSNDEPVDGPDIATGPVAETESDESTAEDGWPTYHVTEADVWAPSRSEEETALEKSATAPEESATDPEDPASVPEDLATAPQGLASESDHATKSHLQSEPFQ
ncbi:MAG: FHA domain-containing protein, partial [Planctomycetota bacterium]